MKTGKKRVEKKEGLKVSIPSGRDESSLEHLKVAIEEVLDLVGIQLCPRDKCPIRLELVERAKGTKNPRAHLRVSVGRFENWCMLDRGIVRFYTRGGATYQHYKGECEIILVGGWREGVSKVMCLGSSLYEFVAKIFKERSEYLFVASEV